MEKKEKDKQIPVQVPSLELFAVPRGSIVVDPLGSYTGRPFWEDGIPEEMLEQPVQDADDL